MKCAETRSLFGSYMDNELPLNTREALERHMEGCDACREELKVMSNIDNLCRVDRGSGFTDEYMNNFVARLHQKILTEGIRREQRTFFLFRPSVQRFVFGLAAVLLISVSFIFPRFSPQKNENLAAVPVVYYAASDKEEGARNYLTNSEMVLINLVSMPEGKENMEILKKTVSQSGLKEQIDSALEAFKDNPELLKHAKAMEIVSIKILNTGDSSSAEDIRLLKQQINESGLLQKTQSMKI